MVREGRRGEVEGGRGGWGKQRRGGDVHCCC